MNARNAAKCSHLGGCQRRRKAQGRRAELCSVMAGPAAPLCAAQHNQRPPHPRRVALQPQHVALPGLWSSGALLCGGPIDGSRQAGVHCGRAGGRADKSTVAPASQRHSHTNSTPQPGDSQAVGSTGTGRCPPSSTHSASKRLGQSNRPATNTCKQHGGVDGQCGLRRLAWGAKHMDQKVLQLHTEKRGNSIAGWLAFWLTAPGHTSKTKGGEVSR
jgi:hypothetical protein